MNERSERMRNKKLLTMAGAVAILACGACLPPPPQHGPRPPVWIGVGRIQRIRVDVANASPGHHLDSAALAQKIVDTINEQSWRMNTRVNAYVGKNVGDVDAVLAITILSETAEALTPAKTKIRILINHSATLTRLDGVLVWRAAEAGSPIVRNVAEGDPADAWQDPRLVDEVDKALSNRLVFHMLYDR